MDIPYIFFFNTMKLPKLTCGLTQQTWAPITQIKNKNKQNTWLQENWKTEVELPVFFFIVSRLLKITIDDKEWRRQMVR
jgi:hypothetical protein